MNKKNIIISILIFLCIIFTSFKVKAAPEPAVSVPKFNISVDNPDTPKEYVDNLKLLILFTVLTLLPSFIVMMTSFTRIIVVFSFLRGAIGTQQAPPNQVLIGLSICLTIFIMAPVYSQINKEAVTPYINNEISQEKAMEIGAKPLRNFMLKQTRQKDLSLFIDVSKIDKNTIYNDKNKLITDKLPMYIVVPSFVISELRTAFSIGFLLYIPFLIIDLVVASVLMSMGMFMLPPVMVSLPFKLLLFVMVDGWHLLVKSLITSFAR